MLQHLASDPTVHHAPSHWEIYGFGTFSLYGFWTGFQEFMQHGPDWKVVPGLLMSVTGLTCAFTSYRKQEREGKIREAACEADRRHRESIIAQDMKHKQERHDAVMIVLGSKVHDAHEVRRLEDFAAGAPLIVPIKETKTDG